MQVLQRLLCDHGRFPSEVLKCSFRELKLMAELMKKEAKEFKEAARGGKK